MNNTLSTRKVALVCTGTSCLDEDKPQKVQTYLRNHYAIDAIYSSDTYQALSAQTRASIFLDYLFDPDLFCINVLRGGEGSADILPYINEQAERIAQLPVKYLVGFSDFTPILIYFSQRFQWPVIHGPGLWRLVCKEIGSASGSMLMQWLLDQINTITLNDLKPLNNAAQQSVCVSSTVIGGTLSLLNISIKDIWEINLHNKIVIIEDVNEKAHVIGRTLKYLKRIGIFDQPKALIFGDFNTKAIGQTEDEQRSNATAINATLNWFAKQCDFPVLHSQQFGHGRINLPVPFNKPATLQLGEQGKLIITK